MQKYNAETSILTEQALEAPSQDIISAIQQRISSFDLQISVLQNQINSLNITTDPASYYTESSPISPAPIG